MNKTLHNLKRKLFPTGSASYQRTATWAKIKKVIWPTWIFSWIIDGLSAFFVFKAPAWSKHLKANVDMPVHDRTAVFYLNPVNWLVWSFRFVVNWLTTRPWTSIGPTIPALAALGCFVVLLIEYRTQSPVSDRGFYSRLLQTSMDTGDYATASVAVGALIDSNPANQLFRWQRVRIEDARGNKELAKDLAMQLATSRDFGPAAVWLIEELHDLSLVQQWESAEHQQFRSLMEIAKKDNKTTDLASVNVTMAEYLGALGDFADAVLYVTELAEREPRYSLLAAAYAFHLGDKELLKRHASAAERYFEEQVQERPTDLDTRLNLARALVLNRNEERAIRVLSDGSGLGEKEKLGDAMAEAMITWANRIGKEEKGEQALAKRLNLVRQAADIAPNMPLVIDSIITLTLECRDSSNNEIVDLRNLAVKGLDPASIHFIRGTVALYRQDYKTAETHLSLAAQVNQNLPGVLNNLAMALTTKGSEEDLEVALRLAEAALKELPGHPYVHETRGQILARLGKHEEAIVDFEASLAAQELRPQVIPQLAASYRALGQEALAQQYESSLDGDTN